MKRNKLAAAREAALTNEQVIFLNVFFINLRGTNHYICHPLSLFDPSPQAMLEARMGAEELPSWVFFPDKDRAEWVNNILKQVHIT